MIKWARKSHLFAIDECSVQLITPIKRIVARRGSKPEMKTSYLFKGITVIGGIDATGRLLYKLQEQATNAEDFANFLEYVRTERSKGKIHMILDNASFHTRNWIRDLATKLSIVLHFQPTHSPFLNAAEEIWRQLKEYLRGILFYELPALKAKIDEFFKINRRLNINLVRYLG